jgi:hypothetical protein
MMCSSGYESSFGQQVDEILIEFPAKKWSEEFSRERSEENSRAPNMASNDIPLLVMMMPADHRLQMSMAPSSITPKP